MGDDLLDTDAEFDIVPEPYSLAPVDRMYLILRFVDDLGALHGRKDTLKLPPVDVRFVREGEGLDALALDPEVFTDDIGRHTRRRPKPDCHPKPLR